MPANNRMTKEELIRRVEYLERLNGADALSKRQVREALISNYDSTSAQATLSGVLKDLDITVPNIRVSLEFILEGMPGTPAFELDDEQWTITRRESRDGSFHFMLSHPMVDAATKVSTVTAEHYETTTTVEEF